MHFRFDTFNMSHMILCGKALRACGDQARCMEEAARNVVDYLYEAFRFETQEGEDRNACALIRLFKTHPLMELEKEQRKFALDLLGGQYDPRTVRCLTMLATRGAEEEWNDRHRSRGHVAIPLPSPGAVSAFPMITQLVTQLGLDIENVIRPDSELYVKLGSESCGVFHVPRAWGSPSIPEQEKFVVPYGIESVLGFGGVLPYGDMYTIILFSRVPIAREVAERFQTLSLHVKMALLPFTEERIFMPSMERVKG